MPDQQRRTMSGTQCGRRKMARHGQQLSRFLCHFLFRFLCRLSLLQDSGVWCNHHTTETSFSLHHLTDRTIIRKAQLQRIQRPMDGITPTDTRGIRPNTRTTLALARKEGHHVPFACD